MREREREREMREKERDDRETERERERQREVRKKEQQYITYLNQSQNIILHINKIVDTGKKLCLDVSRGVPPNLEPEQESFDGHVVYYPTIGGTCNISPLQECLSETSDVDVNKIGHYDIYTSKSIIKTAIT